MFPVILTTQKDQETNTPCMILIWGAGYSIFYTLTNIRWSIYMHIYIYVSKHKYTHKHDFKWLYTHIYKYIHAQTSHVTYYI